MLILILKKFRRRCLALVIAIAVLAGCLAAVSPQPASAQTSQTAQMAAQAAHASPAIPTNQEQLCLTNSNGAEACVGFPVQDVVQDVIAAAGVAAAWVAIWFQWISKGSGDGGQEGEEEDTGAAGDGDPDAGLCLAQTEPNPITGYTGDLYMTTCGANGTVWIAYPHGDGYYLESRWWYDQGLPNEILSTSSTSDGSAIFVSPASGNYWHTWSWYPTSHK